LFHRRFLLPVTLPALGISLLLGTVCLLGIRSLNRLQTDRSQLLAKDVAGLEAAQEMEVRLRQVRSHSFLYVLEPTSVRKRILDEDHAQFEMALYKARDAADRPEELVLIARVELGYQAYIGELYDQSRWPPNGSTIQQYLAWADSHPLQPLLKPCDELLAINRQSMETTAASNAELTLQTRWMMILLGTLGPLAGLIGGAGVAWGLSRSFTKLQLRIRDTHAELDRDLGSIQVAADGDVRHLDRQMEMVLARVRTVVDQLQTQQRDLDRAEQMAAVGHLAAEVAHEVRNPLTGVKLLIEAAIRPASPRAMEPAELQMILNEIGRIERTVQGLLDFARPSHLDRREVNFGELLRGVIESMRGRAEARSIQILWTPPSLPVRVFADCDQVIAALSNLLINAIEASPIRGEVRVELRWDEAGIRVIITDSGPGIAPAMLAKLFTPFATGKPTGTGLGLFVVRRIVREHGGELTAQNDTIGGARFEVQLPGMEIDHAETAGRR